MLTGIQTRTEVDIPAYAPASVQLESHLAPYGTYIVSEAMTRLPSISAPPAAATGDGSVRGLKREKRDSVVSVPRFRDVQSWARDQTGRLKMGSAAEVSEIPKSARYSSVDGESNAFGLRH